jgi:hypothetical protein
LFCEQDLRKLLGDLDRAPREFAAGFPDLDLLGIVRIANRLQPLGKEKALAAVEEYLRVHDRRTPGPGGVQLALLLLFEPPEGQTHLPQAGNPCSPSFG